MLYKQWFIDDRQNRPDLMRRVMLVFVCLVLASNAVGQDSSKPILLDEFGSITWEDYVARLDNLIVHLQTDSNLIGYIIIQTGDVAKDPERFRYYRWAKDHIRLRSFDISRVRLIRSVDRETQSIFIWIAPSGAEPPDYVEAEWNLEIPPGTKPFVWTTTEWNSGLVTPAEHLGLDHFSDILSANPKARANFVIRARSTEQHSRERSEIMAILGKHKISQRRLKFFFVFETNPRLDYPQTEVWLLP